MTTKEECLKALEVIEKYHQQAIKEVNKEENNKNKTDIRIWFSALKSKPSTRLRKLLLEYPHTKTPPFEYVEDINVTDFLRLRNAGIKTWKEFEDLRNETSDISPRIADVIPLLSDYKKWDLILNATQENKNKRIKQGFEMGIIKGSLYGLGFEDAIEWMLSGNK